MSIVLIIANNDVGLYKFRKELINELVSRGNKVFISLPNGDFIQSLVDIGCIFIDTKIDRRGINPLKDIGLILFYSQIIKKYKPDLVINYTIKPNIYGGMASRINNVSYAINITGLGSAFYKNNILKRIVVFLYRISCKKAKVVFFENEENKNIFINHKIVKMDKAFVLNGAGVNIQEYNFADYPMETNTVKFLFIGRVMKEKGINELIMAAKKIKSNFNNVFFEIVGPYEEDYSEELTALTSQGIIHYMGYQSDVKPFIKNANCFVLPSYHEGMANTLLECGAMGRPLITSNIPGCKETVIDGKTGFLIKAGDSESLYEKLVEFILLPYDQKKKMGYNATQYITQNFNKDLVVNMTLNKLKMD